MQKLKVGDTVSWRGAWGREAPETVKVVGIQRVSGPGEKYGPDVPEMDWSDVPYYAVVDLANSHWAYGAQIQPHDS